MHAGQALLSAGQYDAAIEALKKSIELDPNFPMAHFFLAASYSQTNNPIKALVEYRKEENISRGSSPAAECWLGAVYAGLRSYADARKIRDDLLERSKETYITPYGLAIICFTIFETDRGFEWLEKAYEEHDVLLVGLREYARVAAPEVRLDPRFQTLLEKIGLAHREEPLIEAAQAGDTETVRDLIAQGADANTRDYYGWEPLMYAAWFEHTDTVKLLVELGADVNAKERSGSTALIAAAEYGRTDTAKLLVELGAEVDAKRSNGKTALRKAAENGRTDTVKLLVELGADIDAKDLRGRTVLMGAAMGGYTDTVKLLLDKGADMNIRSNWRVIVDKVVGSGLEETDLELEDLLGWTALTYAEHEGHTEVVKLLKEAGAKK
jgi:ankyrin repeat protein